MKRFKRAVCFLIGHKWRTFITSRPYVESLKRCERCKRTSITIDVEKLHDYNDPDNWWKKQKD